MSFTSVGALDDLSRHAADAIVAIDLGRRVLRLNPMAETLFGITEAEAAGQPCQGVLKLSLCSSACPLDGLARGGRPVTNFNIEVALREKPALPACVVSSALRDGAGRVIGIVESIRDVRHVIRLMEERERAVHRAEEAVAWLGAVVDTINDAVIATDSSVLITSFNRAAETLTGYSREEVLGRSCKEILSDGFCPLEETIVRGGGFPGIELQMRAKDGRAVPVWLTTQPLRDAAGRIIGAVQLVRDRSAIVPATPAEGASGRCGVIGSSAAMQPVYAWIDRLAPTDSTVLLTGESGTGKDLAAECIHFLSPRRDKPLIKVNCAALPEALLESELFGHVRGAYTGAVNDRPGRFELAHQGTLFLDEIGDLPLPLQGMLLRVLQDRSVDRLGSGRPIPIDLRIIAATNRDLTAMIAEGRFRQDLYYRLAVIPLHLPPLRERLEDIPALAAAFLHKLSRRLPSAPAGISPAALSVLAKHDWPGNVRELENALEFAAIRASAGVIEPQDLPPHLHSPARIARAPELPGRERIAAALRQAANAAEAARRLGMSRATLFRRMRQFGLGMPRKRTASPHHRPA